MLKEKTIIWNDEEYTYPAAFGFIPHMVSYLHNDSKIRPCMIIVPGGAYRMTSPAEAEIAALEFYERGYDIFVLTYSTNLLSLAPLKEQPMRDLSRAIRIVRKNAGVYHIHPDQLFLCGFSAGAHLCASICVHGMDILDENEKYRSISNRPDAAILSYPVITTGTYAHLDSFHALLGTDIKDAQLLEYMSLEKHVTKDTPPCFIWQTAEDQSVPVENSYLFAESCKKHGVLFSHHVFSKGPHGLSVANSKWENSDFGDYYSLDQIYSILHAIHDGKIEVSVDIKNYVNEIISSYIENTASTLKERKSNAEAALWTEIADRWLINIVKE